MPRTNSIAIAVISAIATVAPSQATVAYDHLTTLETTPHKFVFNQPATVEELEEALRLSREHCKKFGLVTGPPRISLDGGSNPGVLTTVPCVIVRELAVPLRKRLLSKLCERGVLRFEKSEPTGYRCREAVLVYFQPCLNN